MNDKITFPRLSTMLADRSGRSKRFSEDFLREFFSLISERLEAGESVKIKGLGTFRLSRVEPRRSVDVTTGQPMEISGHSKVVFVPAKELAEAVNAPFEAFTAIEISDDTDLSQIFTKDEIELQEPADDFSVEPDFDIYSDTAAPVNMPSVPESPASDIAETTIIGSSEIPEAKAAADEEDSRHSEEGVAEDRVSEETATEDIPSEDFRAEEDTQEDRERVDGQVKEYSAEDRPLTEDDEHASPDPTDTVSEESSLQELEEADDLETEAPHMKTWVKTLLISLGAAAVALIATFAVWYVFVTNDFSGIFNKTASNTTQNSTDGFVVGNKKATEENATDSLPAEDTVSDSQDVTEESDVPTAPSDALVYDTISTTRYLTTMAKMHYGNYNLWPYIYEENKAMLGHPDRIRPGTVVVIPKLSKFGIDPTNSEDVEKAKKMGTEIYGRYGKKI